MGGDIKLTNEREVGGEPVADITVNYQPLFGIEVPKDQIPLAIDEFPAIFIAAACAKGDTVLRGAAELRVKESDRIEAMANGLETLGIDNEAYEDGIRITGGQLDGGYVDSQGDHRIAMAFTIAGLRAKTPVIVANCANVATSFPGFVKAAQTVGIKVQSHRSEL
jgi:5-enolpyruvylshikimate-3-phosphate synthase